ncbi:F420-dependent NADP oxidoreductase [Acinetobacter apis]|uniref:Predicted oxidoreductase, contains short-chain dehydrogenase (SDR) and DUF2520 domains n=1 Tax=Acinetobacter apis TaxID=1229165 RepID=A0A217ED18_9GAMM|nr:DUF2520 domain-containing protein [Acinetobacter apis]SNQ28351.1 Predicted oxidoreductase, contains short-chain dehydrogenase (SDR) and DUF2520 domains [Acinetobacter apis]
MKISFIGAGRVATHLAHALYAQGFEIVQVYSRNLFHAQVLARTVHATSIDTLADIVATDLMVIAVSDQAIESVITQLATLVDDHTLIVHTSGSTAMQILTKHHLRAGVFYPLQTFSLEREVNWSNTPFLLEAQYDADLLRLNEMARTLSQQIYHYNSEQRLSLHLAAVFANNFSNYCFDIAKQTVERNAVDFNLLTALMKETAEKACQFDPKVVQTGPAMRQDQNTLDAHQSLLQQQQAEDHLAVYRLLSEHIKKRHQVK